MSGILLTSSTSCNFSQFWLSMLAVMKRKAVSNKRHEMKGVNLEQNSLAK